MYFLMKLCTSHIVRFHVRLSWVVSVIQPPFPTSVGNIPQSFFQENRKESPLNLGIFLHGSRCAVNTGPEHMYQHPSTKPIFSNKKEDVDQPNQPNKCHFFQQMHQQKRSALASLASLASRRKTVTMISMRQKLGHHLALPVVATTLATRSNSVLQHC